jgi:hypothetical protein
MHFIENFFAHAFLITFLLLAQCMQSLHTMSMVKYERTASCHVGHSGYPFDHQIQEDLGPVSILGGVTTQITSMPGSV